MLAVGLAGCSQTEGTGPAGGIPIFPGAEGFGTETPGGRGGRVFVVTTLSWDGPGSFAEAMLATEPRIIVFRVSGVIDVPQSIQLSEAHSYVTVAGQTSPGGITFTGDSGTFISNYENNFHDGVFRFLRFRGRGNYDNIAFHTAHHLVFDHCLKPPGRLLNAISVDVEEHFQVSAFERVVRRSDWDQMDSRVETNTDRLLQLFADCDVRATFFTLGWIAQRYPALVRRISDQGHEIGCHGFDHRLIFNQTPDQFREELSRSRQLLEQASGQAVSGYRAASFSITRKSLWALDLLVEAGFRYDSSIFPVYHDRYGMPGAPRRIYRLETGGGGRLIEFPPSTVRWGRLVLPVAGGGYLRIYPFALTRWAIQRLNTRDRMPANVYVHPWEVDPGQPRIQAPLKSRLRHYTNLAATEERLRALMSRFRFGAMGDVVDQQEARGLERVHF